MNRGDDADRSTRHVQHRQHHRCCPPTQAAFNSLMRPLVRDLTPFFYVDNYAATHAAVFSEGARSRRDRAEISQISSRISVPPSPACLQSDAHAVKFAKNSAFHYLNSGRYLMAQMLIHALYQVPRYSPRSPLRP